MEAEASGGKSTIFSNLKCRRPSKKLSYIIAGIALIFIVLGIFLIVHLSTGKADNCPEGIHCNWKSIPSSEFLKDERCEQLCTSKACLKAAEFAVSLINSTQDPCQDFYEFACSAINYAVIIPEVYGTKIVESTETKMARDFLMDIEDAIITDSPSGDMGSALSFVSTFYRNCIVSDIVLETSLNYTMENFKNYRAPFSWSIVGGPPPEGIETVSDKLADFTITNFNPFFEAVLGEDKVKSRYIINLHAPESKMMHNLYTETQLVHGRESIMERYRYVLGSILDLLHVNEPKKSQVVQDVIAIDRDLIKLIEEENKPVYGHPFTCQEMERRFPALKWCIFMKSFLKSNNKPETSRVFAVIREEKYFQSIDKLLERLSARDMVNYLNMKYMMAILPILPDRFRTLYYSDPEIFPKDRIMKSARTKWEQCAALAVQYLWVPLYRHYLEFNFNEEKRQKVEEVMEVMKTEILEAAKDYSWMSEHNRMKLLTQLKNSSTVLDYSHVLPAQEELDRIVDSFTTDGQSFFLGNFLAALKIHHNEDLKISQIFPFAMDVLSGRYTYFFSLGIFRFPILDQERPKYLDYGSLGTVISAAMSRVVDDFFKEHKANLGKTDREGIMKKRKCLRDQFSQFKIDVIDKKVDAEKTADDNFAVTFGLQAAIQAYKKYLKENGEEKGLPGLPFSNEQLFFLSYAQRFCEVRSGIGYKEYVKMSHSPSRHRVNGPLSNSAAFSDAFRCPLGSPMNPTTKCCLAHDDSGSGHRCI